MASLNSGARRAEIERDVQSAHAVYHTVHHTVQVLYQPSQYFLESFVIAHLSGFSDPHAEILGERWALASLTKI